MRLSVERADDDAPHGLELDLVRALLQRVSQVLGRGRVDQVVMDDGVACRRRVHGVGEGDLSRVRIASSLSSSYDCSTMNVCNEMSW